MPTTPPIRRPRRPRGAGPLAALALALALAAAPLGAGSAAHAGTVDRTDPRGDVGWVSDADDLIRNSTTTASVDILRVRVDHSRWAVRYSMRIRALSTRGVTTFGGTVRTSRGGWFSARVLTTPGRPRGVATLADRRGGSVACPGLAHTVSHTQNKVTLTVPTRCLGDPTWIRTDVAATTQASTTSDRVYADDGLRRFFVDGGALAVTGRIGRG